MSKIIYLRAYIYFAIAAIFWGLNFHLAKIMLAEVGIIEAGFWRYLFGVIPLLLMALKRLPSLTAIRKNLKGVMLIGVICLFGFNFFFFLGLTKSPAINGALIVSLTPAITLLFSRMILKTQLKRKELIGVIISFLGVLYLILKGSIGDISSIAFSWGDIMLILSASCFGLQNVWIKKYGGDLSNINFTFLTNLVCMLSFMALLPFLELGNPLRLSMMFWLSALGIGFLGTSAAYYMWNKGIELTSPNQAGVFINVVPLSAAAFSFLLGEELYAYHLISGLFIILGVVIIVNKKTIRDVG